MTIFKTSLMASAAVLIFGVGAKAADLPAFKSAPVNYVRVCDAFGEGYFYIPGTDTCLKVGGQVRAEYTIRGNAPYGNAFASALNQSGTVYKRDETSERARGFLNTETKTATAYGTLRTFLSLRITVDPTQPGPSGGRGSAFNVTPPRAATSFFQGFNGEQTLVDKGFIQFAGITAGRSNSFFDFDAQSHELLSNSLANSNQTTELLAYTATFGAGFSATISVEDRTERELGDNGSVAGNLSPTATKAGYLAYAGEAIPDIVGNLRVDQDWGSAQIAGAYHQVTSVDVTVPGVGVVAPKDKDGFAGIAGVKILLPTLAKGDNLTLQGTYEEGAMDYINPINYYNGLSNIYTHNISVSVPVNDGFILPGGQIGLNKAYGGYAAFQHYWSPTWNSTIFGDYVQINNPRAAQLLTSSADNASIYQVGGNLLWTPVKNLIIGGEVLYSNMHLSGSATLVGASVNAGGTATNVPSTADDVRGRLSLRRSF